MKNSKTYKILVCTLIIAAVSTGCASSNETQTDISNTSQSSSQTSSQSSSQASSIEETSSNIKETETPAETGLAEAAEAVNVTNIEFKAKDTYTDYSSEGIEIALADNATKSGSGYSVDGNRITITKAGTYVLSGSLSNGQIIVDATNTDDVRLVLNNVNITCSDSAPIYVNQADKVIISLPDGTDNNLTDQNPSQNSEGEDITAVIYSKDSLTFNGSGKLNINANNNDGIATKDTLKITGGNIIIKSIDDGLVAKDKALIRNGSIQIECEGDGVKVTNTETNTGYFYMEGGKLTVKSGNDGIQAETSMLITGGEIDITTGGGSAEAPVQNENEFGGGHGGFMPMNPDSTDTTEDSDSIKGLKATSYIDITGGTITLNTYDDSIHANNTIRISNGTISATSGDDGIHADSALEISGGTINITKSYEGLEASNITVSNGNISVIASDDGINAAGGNDSSSLGGRPGQNPFDVDSEAFVLISGGNLEINASGDGLDSNGALTISGGTVRVSGPTNSGNGTIDTGSEFIITGGDFLGAGSSGMMVTPSNSSTQNSITVVDNNYEANSTITIKDASGNILAEYTNPKSFNAITFSSSKIELNKDYSFYVNGELVKTVTADSLNSGDSGNGGMGDMGGMGGVRPGRF